MHVNYSPVYLTCTVFVINEAGGWHYSYIYSHNIQKTYALRILCYIIIDKGVRDLI